MSEFRFHECRNCRTRVACRPGRPSDICCCSLETIVENGREILVFFCGRCDSSDEEAALIDAPSAPPSGPLSMPRLDSQAHVVPYSERVPATYDYQDPYRIPVLSGRGGSDFGGSSSSNRSSSSCNSFRSSSSSSSSHHISGYHLDGKGERQIPVLPLYSSSSSTSSSSNTYTHNRRIQPLQPLPLSPHHHSESSPLLTPLRRKNMGMKAYPWGDVPGGRFPYKPLVPFWDEFSRDEKGLYQRTGKWPFRIYQREFTSRTVTSSTSCLSICVVPKCTPGCCACPEDVEPTHSVPSIRKRRRGSR